MTREEIEKEIYYARKIFDSVRLVDPIERKVCELETCGISRTGYSCFHVWQKSDACENCLSARALVEQNRYTKFEFSGKDVYFVVLRYVNVEGCELVLENAVKLEDRNFFKTNNETVHSFFHKFELATAKLYTDELTGAYNRKYLNEQLPIALKKTAQLGTDMALAIVDIDNFKSINDNWGHPVGDEVLVGVVNHLKNGLRSTGGDYVVRYGGDEFIVVFYDITCHTFLKRLEEYLTTASAVVSEIEVLNQLSFSIGGVMASECDVLTPKRLIGLADERLYQSKNNGKSCITVKQTYRLTQRNVLLSYGEILRRIETGDVYIVYQPKVFGATGAVSGLEALIRVDGGAPNKCDSAIDFIKVLEKNRLSHLIDFFVFYKAVEQLSLWKEAGAPIVPIAINMCHTTLLREDFLKKIVNALLDSDLRPFIEIEITERNVPVEHVTSLSKVVKELRALDIRVGLDDFGAGSANIVMLAELNLDFLKIDRTIVVDVQDNRISQKILEVILKTCSFHGVKVIVEGVGNALQYMTLKKIGFEYFQGYFFSRPVAIEDVKTHYPQATADYY